MALLLAELGCTVPVHLYPETSGVFPRPPEPIASQLTELSAAVVQHKCDLGIAVGKHQCSFSFFSFFFSFLDPDVDRCVLLDEAGLCVTEEYTLACAVSYMCHTLGKKGLVVRNLSSSRVSDDIATANGSTVLATPVGGNSL
jgi:phosphomannomutase